MLALPYHDYHQLFPKYSKLLIKSVTRLAPVFDSSKCYCFFYRRSRQTEQLHFHCAELRESMRRTNIIVEMLSSSSLFSYLNIASIYLQYSYIVIIIVHSMIQSAKIDMNSILIIEGLTCHKKPLSFAAKYIITTHYQTLSEGISPGLLVCKIRLTITRLIIHGLISLVPAYQSFRWSGTDTDLNLAALLSQITLSLVQISIL